MRRVGCGGDIFRIFSFSFTEGRLQLFLHFVLRFCINRPRGKESMVLLLVELVNPVSSKHITNSLCVSNMRGTKKKTLLQGSNELQKFVFALNKLKVVHRSQWTASSKLWSWTQLKWEILWLVNDKKKIVVAMTIFHTFFPGGLYLLLLYLKTHTHKLRETCLWWKTKNIKENNNKMMYLTGNILQLFVVTTARFPFGEKCIIRSFTIASR